MGQLEMRFGETRICLIRHFRASYSCIHTIYYDAKAFFRRTSYVKTVQLVKGKMAIPLFFLFIFVTLFASLFNFWERGSLYECPTFDADTMDSIDEALCGSANLTRTILTVHARLCIRLALAVANQNYFQ